MKMNGKNSKNKELEGFLKKTQMILAKGIKKGERGYRKFFRNKIRRTEKPCSISARRYDSYSSDSSGSATATY